jgi:hypothetical protein
MRRGFYYHSVEFSLIYWSIVWALILSFKFAGTLSFSSDNFLARNALEKQ